MTQEEMESKLENLRFLLTNALFFIVGTILWLIIRPTPLGDWVNGWPYICKVIFGPPVVWFMFSLASKAANKITDWL